MSKTEEDEKTDVHLMFAEFLPGVIIAESKLKVQVNWSVYVT